MTTTDSQAAVEALMSRISHHLTNGNDAADIRTAITAALAAERERGITAAADVAALVRQMRDALAGCDALADGSFRLLGDQPAGSAGQHLKTELACRSISIRVAIKNSDAFLAQQEAQG